MPESLRAELDEFAETHGYDGRSEVIRAACKSLLEDSRSVTYAGHEVIGTVTAVFGYDDPAIERQMMDIRHEFEDEIRSNSHDCLRDNAGCVETFVVEAEAETVSRFVETLRATDESVAVERTLVPIDSTDPDTGASTDGGLTNQRQN